MSKNKLLQHGSPELRGLAEERLRRSGNIPMEPSPVGEEPMRLIHELQVHQIELEMQNVELLQARAEREKMEVLLGKYNDLYDYAPAGYFNLDPAGIIHATNLTGAGFLGIERSMLINRRLDLFLSGETRPVFNDFLKKVFASEAKETCEVVILREGYSPLFVQVEAVASESRKVCRAVVIDITGRKQAEEAHSRLAALVESSDDAIIDMNLNGVILSWNAGSERLFGYRPDEAIGKPITLVLPPELKEEEDRILRRLSVGERVEHFETVRLTRDGKRVEVSVTASPVIDNQGRIIGASKIARDITGRKLAEKALHESEERFHMLFETMTEGFALHEIILGDQGRPCDYRFLDVNPAFERLTGLKRVDLIGKRILEVMPDIEPYWLENYGKVALTGESMHLENYSDALKKWYDVFAYRPAPGRFAVVFTDITERKRAEEALRQSEQQFRTLADAIPHLCWMANADGWIFWYNQRWHEYTGTTPEQMVGWGWQSVHDPKVLPQVLKRWQASIATGQLFDMVFPLRGSDGVFRPFLTRVMPVRDQNGKVIRWFGTNTDISESKKAEEELQKSRDELESRVRERTEDLANSVKTLRREITVRKRAETSLKRLNRLHAVLSETNQAIVRAADHNSLFNDFCRIAVENGGFLLAWIGLINNGTGQVEVAASHGVTSYLNGIRISANYELAGEGPTGISIRQGTYYICNDFLNDPCTRPWHDRGRASGIRASASIVLKQEGEVIGALTVYADEKDFFDQQQVKLLQQMGEDISFALDNIVRETRHRETEQALREETAERLRVSEELHNKDRLLILQSRQAAMGETIDFIAHQWKQPLNTLSLIVQYFRESYRDGEMTDEDLDKTVDQITDLVMHMAQTIDDFRSFSRPDRDMRAFKLKDMVAKTVALVGDSFKAKRILVTTKADDDLMITSYQNEYCQVLLNILNNARDALVERNVTSPRIEIELFKEGERTVTSISDNAGGIPEEIIERIFEPYFTTKNAVQGTGIGLYMSKTIIEKNMKGKISVRNTGEGAEFRIEV